MERKEFDFADEDFEHIKEIIVKIRNIRAEMNVPVTKKLNLFVAAKTREALIKDCSLYIEKLAGVNSINYIGGKEEIDEKVSNAVAEDTELYIPLGEMIDFDKESARLNKEIGKAETEIQRGKGCCQILAFCPKLPPNLWKKSGRN